MHNTEIDSYKSLLKLVKEHIVAGWKDVSDIERLSFGHTSESYWEDEELEFSRLMLVSRIRSLFISTTILLEKMELPELLTELKKEYEKYENDLGVLKWIPYIAEQQSPVLAMFWRYESVLSAYLGEKSALIDDHVRLERILKGTAKIVLDRKIEPNNEAQVRQCIYDLLVHVFPDTVRETPISQVTKTYKPDIGVPSLKTAIEYKFAANADEAKKAVGGLYEDMRGYAGSEDWEIFYGVVYMSGAFFTDDQIKAEFKHTKADDNWRPILVVGGGARKKRTPKNKGSIK